ncbi:BMP family ABC transporter substrate-binding protein [Meiothermus rufus]|uniref:BMP family ABC transporter substrate-binding protein n=1 Tax=Meiothermus rufus TaxID=604332 RepID=UPI00040119B1|nr:BMP family ABC transporter substrate-binding protein [Meiothermus rufus]
MKKTLFLLLAVWVVGFGLAQDKLKACWIYVGPIGDYGWSHAHDVGRKEAMKALPWLETAYVESVPEAQVEPTIDKLVSEGCKVIFATSFGYMDGVLNAAKKYPEVLFGHATGYKRAPNVMTYLAEFNEVYYLNGLIAGALTKSGKVGYVAAFPIPEVKRHISAFALGVREVNPRATINVRWINAWFDPAKATEATNALMAQGNDVFAFTEDTPAVIQAAAKRNLPAFGHYSPMQKFSPKTVPSGQLVRWEKIYIDFLSKVRNGTYTNRNLDKVDYWWLLKEGAVELGGEFGVPINPAFVPALKAKRVTDKLTGKQTTVYDLVMARYEAMKAGKFSPFTGPIRDRNGILRVPAGQVYPIYSDKPGANQASMEWAAPGIVGQWPNEPKN